MKTIYSLLFFLLLGTGLDAQENVDPIVFSQTGKAKFKAGPDSKKVKVSPGTDLALTGTLKLKKRSTLGLYNDGRYTFLTGPGTFTLADELAPAKTEESRVVSRLGEQLVVAIHPYFRTSSAGAGDIERDPPPSRPSRPGHGNKEAKVAPVVPYPGKVNGASITFQWELAPDLSSVPVYTLKVMDDDEQMLKEVSVTGTSRTLTAQELGLETGEVYLWEVTAIDQPDVSTGILEFEYADDTAPTNLRQRLMEEEAYRKASPAAKMLLEAATMENAEFYTEAYSILRAAEKEFKKDSLVEWMVRLFAWRNQ